MIFLGMNQVQVYSTQMHRITGYSSWQDVWVAVNNNQAIFYVDGKLVRYVGPGTGEPISQLQQPPVQVTPPEELSSTEVYTVTIDFAPPTHFQHGREITTEILGYLIRTNPVITSPETIYKEGSELKVLPDYTFSLTLSDVTLDRNSDIEVTVTAMVVVGATRIQESASIPAQVTVSY
jgi:hypothetical protein